jgi:tetratricopeptide (TPR) repeat protein
MATCAEALAFVQRRGLAEAMDVWFRSSLLSSLLDLGDWDRVLAEAEAIVAWERAQDARYVSVSAECHTALVLCARGQVAAAAELLERTVPDAREIDDLQAIVPALATAAVVGAAGDTDAAAAALDELAAIVAERDGGQWYRAQWIAELARVAAALGRLELVKELIDTAWPDVARHRHGAASAAAVLAEAGGRLEDAAALYEQAAEGWRAYGHVAERGHALLGAGRCLAALGRPEAGGRLAQGRELLAGLGVPAQRDAVDAWRQRHGEPRNSSGQAGTTSA